MGTHKLGQFGAQPHFKVLFLVGLAPGDVRFVMTQLPLWVKGSGPQRLQGAEERSKVLD